MRNCLILILLTLTLNLHAQVGVGIDVPNPSAMLHINSTTQGFLPPRMTAAQRDAITGPAAGLVIWCNNVGKSGEIEVYNGTKWTNLIGSDIALIPGLPTITTIAASSITAFSASSGGTITFDGYSQINVKGVCWSTSQNPTTADSKTSNGTGSDAFIGNLSGLLTNTTYYVRAYATNAKGTGYGNQLSFTTNSIDVTTGLELWYPFTGSANDMSSKGNNGTIHGPILTADRFGNPNSAYSFNGTSDYIEINNVSLPSGNSSRSFSFWAYIIPQANQSWNAILSYGNSAATSAGTQCCVLITVNSADIDFRNFAGFNNTISPILSNTWKHIVITYNQNNINDIRIYIDGILLPTQYLNYNNITSINTSVYPTALIGKCTFIYPYYFNGKIDDLRVYSRVLTKSEVSYLYSH